MDLPSNFQLTSNSALVESTKFTIQNLYLHHIYEGPNPNQLVLIDGAHGFGNTVVNSWEIYEGYGPKAQVVARADGLHIYAKSWHNSFSILFEHQRLKDSTLQVMGSWVQKEGEWAIVGGTGEFAMARGIIKRKIHEEVPGGEILELDILGYCNKLSFVVPVTKSEAWGTQGNSVHDIKEKPLRIQSVTLRTSDLVDGIRFTYTDKTGQTHNEGLWGFTHDGTEHPLTLRPSEYLKEVSGVLDKSSPRYFLRSIKLVTNQREFGPYGGTGGGTPFKSNVPEGSMIVGFHGSSGSDWGGGTHGRMMSLGVYTVPRDHKTE